MSSANTGECVTTGGLFRPTHLCVAHFELHKKVIFCDVVKLEGVGVWWSMFQEVGLYEVSERGGGIWVQGSHSLRKKAVEQSGGAGSDAPELSSWW